MATVVAALLDAHCVEGPQGSIVNSSTGGRYVYRLTVSCGTMTAGDSASVVTCDVKLQNITKKGKTVTLRAAGAGGPGITPGGTAAYALDATISGTTLTFSVGGPTAAAAVAAAATCNVYVTVDES
jgi:hypothetical protein